MATASPMKKRKCDKKRWERLNVLKALTRARRLGRNSSCQGARTALQRKFVRCVVRIERLQWLGLAPKLSGRPRGQSSDTPELSQESIDPQSSQRPWLLRPSCIITSTAMPSRCLIAALTSRNGESFWAEGKDNL